MGAGSPKVRNGSADGRILFGAILVDVAGVGNLSLGGRVDAMDLARREALEMGKPKLLRKRVDLGVPEELLACHVYLRDRRVPFERALAGDLLWKVVACIQELEERPHCVDVFVGELYLTRLVSESVSPFFLMADLSQ